MIPVVFEESSLTLFKFYHNGQVQEGLRYATDLYSLHAELGHDQSLQAYQAACALLERGVSLLISCSADRYALWVSLRSPVSSLAPVLRLEVG